MATLRVCDCCKRSETDLNEDNGFAAQNSIIEFKVIDPKLPNSVRIQPGGDWCLQCLGMFVKFARDGGPETMKELERLREENNSLRKDLMNARAIEGRIDTIQRFIFDPKPKSKFLAWFKRGRAQS